jgi:hypothetical protein
VEKNRHAEEKKRAKLVAMPVKTPEEIETEQAEKIREKREYQRTYQREWQRIRQEKEMLGKSDYEMAI